MERNHLSAGLVWQAPWSAPQEHGQRFHRGMPAQDVGVFHMPPVPVLLGYWMRSGADSEPRSVNCAAGCTAGGSTAMR